MENTSNLSTLLGTYLSTSEWTTFNKLGEYEWFRYENEIAFQNALEPLAYAAKLGLKPQVKNYFLCVMATYFGDVFSKTSHLVRKELRGDGSPLSSGEAKIIEVEQLDTLMPGSALSAIGRLSEEGFAVHDFGIAKFVGRNEITLVVWIGVKWLKVMSWKEQTMKRKQS